MGVSHIFPEGLDTRVLGGGPPIHYTDPLFSSFVLTHIIAQALYILGVDLGALSSRRVGC